MGAARREGSARGRRSTGSMTRENIGADRARSFTAIPRVTPRDCYARVAIPRRAMAASQSETAGLLASDDVVRPREHARAHLWKVIGGGLTVRPRCAILGRDETSRFLFPEPRDRLTRATFPLVLQALALVGAGCVAATRARASASSAASRTISPTSPTCPTSPSSPSQRASARSGSSRREHRRPRHLHADPSTRHAFEPSHRPPPPTSSAISPTSRRSTPHPPPANRSTVAESLSRREGVPRPEESSKPSPGGCSPRGCPPSSRPRGRLREWRSASLHRPASSPASRPIRPRRQPMTCSPATTTSSATPRPPLRRDGRRGLARLRRPSFPARSPRLPSVSTERAVAEVRVRPRPRRWAVPAPASGRVVSSIEPTSSAPSSSPLNSFTALGADLLAIGDSTDKLWMLSGCAALLPPDERCDPSMAHMGIPDVARIPRSIATCGVTNQGWTFDATPPRARGECERVLPRRFVRGGVLHDARRVPNRGVVRDETRRRGIAARARPRRGPYDDPRLAADTEGYDGFQLPRSTPLRVDAALERFMRWSRANARWTPRRSSTPCRRRSSSCGNDARIAAVGGRRAADAGPRPTVVVINTNYWPQKFGLADAHTPEAREAFVQKYAAELEALTTRVAGRLRGDRAEGRRGLRGAPHAARHAGSVARVGERTHAGVERRHRGGGEENGDARVPVGEAVQRTPRGERLRRVVSPVGRRQSVHAAEVQQLGGDAPAQGVLRERTGGGRVSRRVGSETRAWIARELDEMPRAQRRGAPSTRSHRWNTKGQELARPTIRQEAKNNIVDSRSDSNDAARGRPPHALGDGSQVR